MPKIIPRIGAKLKEVDSFPRHGKEHGVVIASYTLPDGRLLATQSPVDPVNGDVTTVMARRKDIGRVNIEVKRLGGK